MGSTCFQTTTRTARARKPIAWCRCATFEKKKQKRGQTGQAASGEKQQQSQGEEDFKHEGETVNTELRVTKKKIEFRNGDEVVAEHDKQSKKWDIKGKETKITSSDGTHITSQNVSINGASGVGINGPTSVNGNPVATTDMLIARDATIMALEQRIAVSGSEAQPMSSGGDIRYLQQLDFPAYAVQLDWLMTDQNLIADGYDLQSALIVALGTDALAPVSEALPDPDATDRRGWWGDTDADVIWGGWPVGCRLWLLRRAKIVGPAAQGGATVAKADGWTREAMRPFTERLIASRVEIFTRQVAIDRIDVEVVVYRGPEPAVQLRYAELWEELQRGDT